MEDWLTTYEAVRISGYELDYVRKLVHTQKIVVANGDSPGMLAAHHIATVVPEIPGTEGLKRGRNPKIHAITSSHSHVNDLIFRS